MDGSRIEVEWDRAAFEYLVTAHWAEAALLIVVQSRDQRRMQVLDVDPATGSTRSGGRTTTRYSSTSWPERRA